MPSHLITATTTGQFGPLYGIPVSFDGTQSAWTGSYVPLATVDWTAYARPFTVSNVEGVYNLQVEVAELPIGDDFLFLIYEQQGATPDRADRLVASRSTKRWGIFPDEPSVGTGDIAVNHNTGGPDNLRATDSAGNGIDAVLVTAYITSEYADGSRVARGQVLTGTDGRWVEDMRLNAGTYRFVFTVDGRGTGSKIQEVA